MEEGGRRHTRGRQCWQPRCSPARAAGRSSAHHNTACLSPEQLCLGCLSQTRHLGLQPPAYLVLLVLLRPRLMGQTRFSNISTLVIFKFHTLSTPVR